MKKGRCVCHVLHTVHPAGCWIRQRQVARYQPDLLCFLCVFLLLPFFKLWFNLLLRAKGPLFCHGFPPFYCRREEIKTCTHRRKLWEQIVCPCKCVPVIYTSAQSCVQCVAGAYLHVRVCVSFSNIIFLNRRPKEKKSQAFHNSILNVCNEISCIQPV